MFLIGTTWVGELARRGKKTGFYVGGGWLWTERQVEVITGFFVSSDRNEEVCGQGTWWKKMMNKRIRTTDDGTRSGR